MMSKDIPDYMRGFDLNDDWGIAGTAAEAPKSPTIDTSKIASTCLLYTSDAADE
mgnify:CR=1 FL=1